MIKIKTRYMNGMRKYNLTIEHYENKLNNTLMQQQKRPLIGTY